MPTLLKLMAMKGADGKSLRVIETIAAGNYKKFGMYLLQDDNRTMVDLIEKDHIVTGAAKVTEAILQKWLTSDAHTRTYQHLIECLRQSELGALAELIATVVQGMLSKPSINSLTRLLTHSPMHRVTHALMHPPIHLPTHSLLVH